jgi:hypothetical protein
VDVENWPELRVRRKSNTISPMETFQLFRQLVPLNSKRMVAERIACRSCAGPNLKFVQRNEVECLRCHKKQWYAMGSERHVNADHAGIYPELHRLGRMLIRVGRPQKAFVAKIPKETQYYWFRCTNCGETSVDYAHGYAKYLTCLRCRSNLYW